MHHTASAPRRPRAGLLWTAGLAAALLAAGAGWWASRTPADASGPATKPVPLLAPQSTALADPGAQGGPGNSQPAPTTAATQAPGSPASAEAPRGHIDLLVHQRAVQAALSSDAPGLAGAAARSIQTCQLLLATDERVRTTLEARQRQHPDPRFNLAAERLAQGVRACQALDPQAAQQLEPLLRRSLAEGDVGSASSLRRQLKDRFDPAAEPALVQALRRDALACHLGSAQALLQDRHRWPQLLSPTEQQVLQQVVDTRRPRRDQDALDSLVQQLPAEARARLKALQQPAGPVDGAAAQALLAQVQARCEAADAQRP